MSKKILIVEDDSFLQGMEVTELKKSGFDIAIATNGKDALKVLETNIPDCVLLDMMLPGEVDGMGVLTEMKNNPKLKTIPVIMFSNMSDAESYKKTKAAGATDFIVKSSVTLKELTEKIQKILG